jgi:hypothetical protein
MAAIIIVTRCLGHVGPSITLEINSYRIPDMKEQAALLIDELVTPKTLRSIATGSIIFE